MSADPDELDAAIRKEADDLLWNKGVQGLSEFDSYLVKTKGCGSER